MWLRSVEVVLKAGISGSESSSLAGVGEFIWMKDWELREKERGKFRWSSALTLVYKEIDWLVALLGLRQQSVRWGGKKKRASRQRKIRKSNFAKLSYFLTLSDSELENLKPVSSGKVALREEKNGIKEDSRIAKNETSLRVVRSEKCKSIQVYIV